MDEQTVKEEKKQKASSELKEWMKSIALAVVIALIIRFFFFETFLVEGTSMHPTLQHHERLIVNKIVYNFKDPEQGDVIVFNYSVRRDFIKRIIALAGDEVEIRNGNLYVNEKLQVEPYIRDQAMYDFGPVVIPQGHVFVLGDNRDNSMDSRDPAVGSISLERVKGKAMLVFWPFSSAGLLNNSA
jgi:signal peptidase I